MKRIIILLFICCIYFQGCKAMEVYTGADGQPHTQLTDSLETASQIVAAGGTAAPQPLGLLALSVSALIGSAASVILTFQANKKKKDGTNA